MNRIRFTFVALALVATATHAAAGGIAVIVNPANANARLTANDVESLFLGKSTAMPNGALAKPVNQISGGKLNEDFYSKVTGKSGAQVKAIWSRLTFSGKAIPPRELASDEDVKKFVAANPDAIGYVDKSTVDASVKVVFSAD